MIKLRRRTTTSVNFFRSSLLTFVLLTVGLSGCKTSAHTSDPRLRQIDELLDSQLPQGTPKSRVIFFLSSQGFPLQNARDEKAVVAIVHRVDTSTLQPATARVTFHFDANDKLKSYELEPAADSPPQP